MNSLNGLVKEKKSNFGKILIISWAVPPIMGSHGRRVANFIKYLNEFGWEIDVLTGLSNTSFPLYDEASLSILPSSVRIFRAKSGLFSKFYYNSKRKSSTDLCKRTNIISKVLIKTIESFWQIFYKLGLFSLFDWTPYAIVYAIKLARRNNYDILISSGPHIVGLIAFIMNKNMKWILDYGDPWVFEPTYRIKHPRIIFWINYYIERYILKKSSHITVTTEETKNIYLDNFKFLKEDKISVIPMGINYDDYININPERTNKFRILYTGCLYPTRGSILPFLNAVKRLKKLNEVKGNLEIIFLGNIDNYHKNIVNEYGLNDIILFKDFMPYHNALSFMAGSDVLLSFGNRGGLQVPGKLFDYIGSRRPILWIKGDERDPALKYLNGLRNVFLCNNECNDIFSKILFLYNSSNLKQLNDYTLSDIPSGFTWRDRALALSVVCGDLIDEKKP